MGLGSSSRQETSWPSCSIARAREEPTRPQPTIRMNTGSPTPPSTGSSLVAADRLGGGAGPEPPGVPSTAPGRAPSSARTRSLSRSPPARPLRSRPSGPSFDLARRLGPDHDCLRRVSAAAWTMPAPTSRALTTSVLTSTPSYSSPTSRRSGQRPPRLLLALGGELGIKRQGEGDVDHIDEVEPGVVPIPPGLLPLGGSQPAGGGDDVVIEVGTKDGDEDVVEGDLRGPAWSAPARSPRHVWSGTFPHKLAVDDVEEEPGHHPAAADQAGASW